MMSGGRDQYAFRRSVRLLSGPGEETASASDVAGFLGFAGEAPQSELTLMGTMAVVARQYLEGVLGQSFVNQDWRMETDGVPQSSSSGPWWSGVVEGPVAMLYQDARYIDLPRFPLVSVQSVKLIDDQDHETETSSTAYYVDTEREPGRIALRSGHVWGDVADRVIASFQVNFTAGYGETADDVPESLRFAVQAMAAYLYDNRGCGLSLAAEKSGALSAINPYRVRSL